MALFNLKRRELQIKIVYYGPGKGGKTTNLEYIYDTFRDRINGEMLKINTKGDRTLFFDFFPLDLGEISGFKIKIGLYTVPGQIKYAATRRLVLNGVDGIVFVADLMKVRRQNNILSLKNLNEDLKYYRKNIFAIPFVFQYNKIDLLKKGVPLLKEVTIARDLNRQLQKPSYIASARDGTNVAFTLKKIILLTTASVKDLCDSRNARSTPSMHHPVHDGSLVSQRPPP